MKERMQIWIKTNRKWLVPLLCVLLGTALGYEGQILFEEPAQPVEMEVYVDDSGNI